MSPSPRWPPEAGRAYVLGVNDPATTSISQEEANHLRERFERVLAAGLAIFSEHSLSAVLQRVVDSAREVVGARYAALGVLSAGGDSLVEFVTSGLTAEEREAIGALPQGRGLLGLLIRRAAPIRIPDISEHPEQYGFPAGHPPMRSFLGAPIVGRDRVFGNLYLTDKIGADEFTAEDERIATLLAAHTAVAVDNARLYEESERLLGRITEMQRQRDLFFAMMNHELRNALTGVHGWAEMLIRGKTPDRVSPAAREVYEASEHTITLLNNFLDLTRLDAGKMGTVLRDVDVRRVIDRVCAGSRPAAEAKRISLQALITPHDLSLRTDPLRLEQILVNLVSNAVRHGPDGTLVTIDAHPGAEWVEFRVSDHGEGVPGEMFERIFEPFERFDPHSGLGTGLGLPVSRRLATVLRGTLAVERSGPDGSTFLLRLPTSA